MHPVPLGVSDPVPALMGTVSVGPGPENGQVKDEGPGHYSRPF